MAALRHIGEADVAGKRVLVRADLNVPIAAGEVTDTTRIERFAPTVSELLEKGASVVIMTHLGRPAGERNPLYSTQVLVPALSKALGVDVQFATDCVGEAAERVSGALQSGQVALLENLRFHKGETSNNRGFAMRLSVNGDIYVNDAFSCAHRAHASTHAIAAVLPDYAGPSLIKEVEALDMVLEAPQRPVGAVVGGAKVSSKIEVLKNLIPTVDYLIIGGGMANTFLAAIDRPMGKSLYEPDALETALEILGLAELEGCRIVLPSDLVVASEFAANAPNRVVAAGSIPDDMMALDVGPKSRAEAIDVLRECKTLLWNGPFGAFEIEPFGTSTFEVARAAADLTRQGRLITVAGGGDTVAALNAAGVADSFTYVSTAGGAFLEWLEGKELPGIEALMNHTNNLEEA